MLKLVSADVTKSTQARVIERTLAARAPDLGGIVLFETSGEVARVDLSALWLLDRAGVAWEQLASEAKRFLESCAGDGKVASTELSLGEGRVAVELILADPRSGIGAVAIVRLVGPRDLGRVADRIGLTRREREVAELAIKGVGNRGIATALGVTSEAVKWHLKNIYRKASVNSRTELASILLGG